MSENTRCILWAVFIIVVAVIVAVAFWLVVTTIMWFLMSFFVEGMLDYTKFLYNIISMSFLLIALMSVFYPAQKIWLEKVVHRR